MLDDTDTTERADSLAAIDLLGQALSEANRKIEQQQARIEELEADAQMLRAARDGQEEVATRNWAARRKAERRIAELEGALRDLREWVDRVRAANPFFGTPKAIKTADTALAGTGVASDGGKDGR